MAVGVKRLSPEIVERWVERGEVLIAGKGASLRHLPEVERRGFWIALNDAANWGQFDAIHLIDFSVLEKLTEESLRGVGYFICPRLLNYEVRIDILGRTVSYFRKNTLAVADVASWLETHGRSETECLFYDYELTTSDERWSNVSFPSSGYVLLNILMKLGCKRLSVIGMDGGSLDITRRPKKRLTLGVFSYSQGREDLVRHKRQKGVAVVDAVFGRPLQVFVGCEREQRLPFEVLRHSILKHSLRDVEVVPMYERLGQDREYLELRPIGRTPFSFQRLFLDKAAGPGTQSVVYLDSDMLVFGDIYDLVNHCVREIGICKTSDQLRARQSSVLVVRNLPIVREKFADARGAVRRLAMRGEEYFLNGNFFNSEKEAILPAHWNSMEAFEPGRTQLLHFTDMDFQPWLSCANPNGWLWVRELLDLIDDGWLSIADVEREMREGHVRPSLVYQLRRRVVDPLGLPRDIRRRDLNFLPPHRFMKYETSSELPKLVKARVRVRNYLVYSGWWAKFEKVRAVAGAYLRLTD